MGRDRVPELLCDLPFPPAACDSPAYTSILHTVTPGSTYRQRKDSAMCTRQSRHTCRCLFVRVLLGIVTPGYAEDKLTAARQRATFEHQAATIADLLDYKDGRQIEMLSSAVRRSTRRFRTNRLDMEEPGPNPDTGRRASRHHEAARG